MVAIVVPALKLLLSMTWSPLLTGISRIVPGTVALIFVLAREDPPADPNLIICKSDFAFLTSCLAWSNLSWEF